MSPTSATANNNEPPVKNGKRKERTASPETETKKKRALDPLEETKNRATNGSNSVKHKPKVAFLGPLGTYSHQAAYEQFHDTAEFIEKARISDVFNALGEVDFGVIPQENTIFGPVVETYDALRKVDSGFIRGEVTLQVRHCLIVRAGVKLSEIDCVMSHEQALGQCSGFLAKNLPHASTMKMTSTAAAAEAVSKSAGSKQAAICSKMCLKMVEGLELLREGIQDEDSNYTRFYVIAKDARTDLPVVSLKARALLRTYCSVGTSAERKAVDIADVIKALKIPIARIDRRPAHDGKAFNDVYFFELRDTSCQDGKTDGNEQVERAIERIRAEGVEAKLLGLW